MTVRIISGGIRSAFRKPPNCMYHMSLTNFIIYSCIEQTSFWTGVELTTVMVKGKGTDGSSRCNFNSHIITTQAVSVFV